MEVTVTKLFKSLVRLVSSVISQEQLLQTEYTSHVQSVLLQLELAQSTKLAVLLVQVEKLAHSRRPLPRHIVAHLVTFVGRVLPAHSHQE